jgi:aldehyde:ferredoxin oxidoreductase
LPSRLRKRAHARPGDAPSLDLDALLAEFYTLRELDEMGRPSRARLEQAGLADLAAALYS